jgi:hypothetical protein
MLLNYKDKLILYLFTIENHLSFTVTLSKHANIKVWNRKYEAKLHRNHEELITKFDL